MPIFHKIFVKNLVFANLPKEFSNLSNLSLRTMTKCIFCNIISGKAEAQIHYQDEEIVIFNDIKPASKLHILAIPKEHLENVNSLSLPDHSGLLNKLITNGRKIIEEKGGNINDLTMGFHLPPFNSVSHLHLHLISPASEMSFLSRVIFRPNTWWFASADQLLDKLKNFTTDNNIK